MKKILDIRHFIILALIITLIVLLKSDKPPKIKEVIKEVPSEPIHDTIPVEVEVPYEVKGDDIYHDTTIYVPTYVQVDTAAILQSFYVTNSFIDTIKLNNNQGFVYLNQTVSENKIASRKWSATVKPKIVREPAPEPPPIKNQVFLGINGAISREDWVNSLGMGVILKTKKDHLYQLGAGVANRTVDGVSGEFRPFLSGGVYWKIKVKKD
jgi:hypothetical protein